MNRQMLLLAGATSLLFSAIACAQGGTISGKFTDAPKRVILGSTIPVTVEYTATEETLLEIGSDGAPTDVMLSLLDGEKAPIRHTPRPVGYPMEGHYVWMADGLYHLAAGERFTARYDLAELFEITKPGRYTARLSAARGSIEYGVTDIVVQDVRVTGTRKVSGNCLHPSLVRRTQTSYPSFIGISCELYVGTVEGGEGRAVAGIRDVKMGGEAWPRTGRTVDVPVGTTVKTVALDVSWKLWAVVEADGKSGLIVWDLASGGASLVIPVTAKAVDIGTTPATRERTGLVVLAGLPGERRMTTWCLSVPAPTTGAHTPAPAF